jgi:hypothetical protein
MAVSRELSRYMLDLVEAQVRLEGSGTEPAEESYQQLRGLSFLVIGCHT